MDGKVHSFRDLLVWQKAHQLVINIYGIAQNFTKKELFGLSSQIKRAVVSIPANLAEGFRRKGAKDKLRFYNISLASLNEVHYYLVLINDLNFADSDKLIEEVGRMLKSYSNKISENEANF